MKHASTTKGFTLLELMIVMVLLSILALLLIGNYTSSMKKGRDSRRKNDLSQIQRALEMYYEDNTYYPVLTDAQLFGRKFCNTSPSACGSSSKTYMTKIPKDPNSNYTYHYVAEEGTSTPQSYYLYSVLENEKGYSGVICGGVDALCRYYVSSSNAPIPVSNP